MKPARGYALLVTLSLLGALAISVGVVWTRLGVARSLEHAESVRLEALWLARSAALAAKPGEFKVEGGSVKTEPPRPQLGGARLVVAEAKVAGGTARVEAKLDAKGQALEWKETFDRAK